MAARFCSKLQQVREGTNKPLIVVEQRNLALPTINDDLASLQLQTNDYFPGFRLSTSLQLPYLESILDNNGAVKPENQVFADEDRFELSTNLIGICPYGAWLGGLQWLRDRRINYEESPSLGWLRFMHGFRGRNERVRSRILDMCPRMPIDDIASYIRITAYYNNQIMAAVNQFNNVIPRVLFISFVHTYIIACENGNRNIQNVSLIQMIDELMKETNTIQRIDTANVEFSAKSLWYVFAAKPLPTDMVSDQQYINTLDIGTAHRSRSPRLLMPLGQSPGKWIYFMDPLEFNVNDIRSLDRLEWFVKVCLFEIVSQKIRLIDHNSWSFFTLPSSALFRQIMLLRRDRDVTLIMTLLAVSFSNRRLDGHEAFRNTDTFEAVRNHFLDNPYPYLARWGSELLDAIDRMYTRTDTPYNMTRIRWRNDQIIVL